MPFMIGRSPIRRTIKYLESGPILLRDQIRILTINYNSAGERHKGARDFIFWRLPQIQFRNPNVQIATFKNLTPSPFIRCYFEEGQNMLIDIDNKKHEEILEHLIKVIGKPQHQIEAEELAKKTKDNPANFGVGCERPCICEVRGQVPCPGAIPLPRMMRGKYKWVNKS